MQAPSRELFLESLRAFVRAEQDWVPTRKDASLYLRPTLIGTEAFLGVRASEQYLFYIVGSPVGAYYGEGQDSVKIWIEREFSRAAPGGIGAVKAGGNYASSLLAAQAAKAKGFAQVLWLDAATRTHVEEVGTMNIFFKIKGKTITPALNGSILPGVMRDSCIEWLKSKGRPVEERQVDIAEVLAAARAGHLEEAWGTGTAASISPIGQFATADGAYTINEGKPGPLATELFQSFGDLFYGRVRDEHGWMQAL
jgi:branched-chain amino acid aminotransferase